MKKETTTTLNSNNLQSLIIKIKSTIMRNIYKDVKFARKNESLISGEGFSKEQLKWLRTIALEGEDIKAECKYCGIKYIKRPFLCLNCRSNVYIKDC